jgi:hypothetical protein
LQNKRTQDWEGTVSGSTVRGNTNEHFVCFHRDVAAAAAAAAAAATTTTTTTI